MDRCTPAPDSFPFQLSVTPSPPQPLTLSSLLHTFYFLTTALFSSASTPFLVRLFNLFTCINTVQTTVIKRLRCCFSLYIFKLLLFYSSHECRNMYPFTLLVVVWFQKIFYSLYQILQIIRDVHKQPETSCFSRLEDVNVNRSKKCMLYLLWKCCFFYIVICLAYHLALQTLLFFASISLIG